MRRSRQAVTVWLQREQVQRPNYSLAPGTGTAATTEAVSVPEVRPQAEGQDVPVWPLVWQRCGVAFCKMLDNYRGWKNRMKKVHRAASLGARKRSMESTQNVCSNRRFPLP